MNTTMADEVKITPRLFTKAQAAAYLSTTPGNYDRLRKLGLVPGYVPGMMRFDRHALDAAIDKLSGIVDQKAVREPEVDPLAHWRKEARAARRAEREKGRDIRKPVRARSKPPTRG